MDVDAVQHSWDIQQQSYMPDREDRLAVMVDLVAETAGRRPRILDLAGGTGSITRRLLVRVPDATSVVLDVDPVLLEIAGATFADDDRVEVRRADLADPAWTGVLAADPPFDAVLTATALHWLPADRIASLYGEARGLLRSGGVLANADHMPDAGLPSLSGRLAAADAQRAAQMRRATGAADWHGWWARLREEPELAAAFVERDAVPHADDHTRSTESGDWHVGALRAAGFSEAGLLWRGRGDAMAVGVAA